MATLTDEVEGWLSRPGPSTLGNIGTVVNLSGALASGLDRTVELETEDPLSVGG
jgi:hypothetical protein